MSGEERPADQAAGPQAETAAQPGAEAAGTGKVTARVPVRLLVAAGAVAAVAAGGGAYALVSSGSPAAARPAAAGTGHHGAAVAAGPLRVTSISPAGGTSQVNGAYLPVTVTFSAPLAAGSPLPALRPPVPGRWQRAGATARFTPTAPFPPATQMTVTVPAGLRSAAGAVLARPLTAHFSTQPYSPVRLSQLLAQLGYLPMSWAPFAGPHLEVAGSGGGSATVTSAGRALAAEVAMAESPPAGRFAWNAGYPATLRSQWRPGAANVIEKGALMAFQSQHGLAINGVASPRVWDALFRAAAAGQRNQAGYTYAITSKRLPETLTIWHNGRQVLRSLTNTGIPISPTVDGTFPVYLRYRYQVMSGTNPDGSFYADPVSFVAYFNGGDAVHYFPRGSYGSEQSLGCVELPYQDAERAWPYLTYGSLVSVTG